MFFINILNSIISKHFTCHRYNLQVSLLDPNEVEHPVPCSCDMTKCILTKAVMLKHVEQSVNGTIHEDNSNILEDEVIDD